MEWEPRRAVGRGDDRTTGKAIKHRPEWGRILPASQGEQAGPFTATWLLLLRPHPPTPRHLPVWPALQGGGTERCLQAARPPLSEKTVFKLKCQLGSCGRPGAAGGRSAAPGWTGSELLPERPPGAGTSAPGTGRSCRWPRGSGYSCAGGRAAGVTPGHEPSGNSLALPPAAKWDRRALPHLSGWDSTRPATCRGPAHRGGRV